MEPCSLTVVGDADKTFHNHDDRSTELSEQILALLRPDCREVKAMAIIYTASSLVRTQEELELCLQCLTIAGTQKLIANGAILAVELPPGITAESIRNPKAKA